MQLARLGHKPIFRQVRVIDNRSDRIIRSLNFWLFFLTNLNLGEKPYMQLTDFKGFTISAKEKTIENSRALLMMYPDLKLSDLDINDDSRINSRRW